MATCAWCRRRRKEAFQAMLRNPERLALQTPPKINR
jgi:hypothetical protein